MKKIVIILISILIALYILLSCMGSGSEYAAERLFYKAMKINSEMAANPDVVPPKLLNQVERSLKTLLEKYSNTGVAKIADITLAEFYVFNKKYKEALARVDSIMKMYDKDPSMMSKALFVKARTYEKQGKWPQALKEYEILRDDYTKTELGLQAPLYIARYYADKGDDAYAKQAYSNAALFYKKLERDNNRKMLGYIASTLLIQTYMKMEEYEKAGAVLKDTVDTYMNQRTLFQLLPLVENIIVTKLKNPEKAAEIYKTILARSKDVKLNKILQKRIDKLTGKNSVSILKS